MILDLHKHTFRIVKITGPVKLGRVIGLVVGMAISLVSVADNKSDSLKTRECLALYQDNLKIKDYQAALPPLEWLLANRPGLYKKIYIDAVKVYDGLSVSASTKDDRYFYQTKVMGMYAERMRRFGEKAKVFNYMAYKAYVYYKDDPSYYSYTLALLDSAFLLNDNKVFKVNYLAYLDMIRKTNDNSLYRYLGTGRDYVISYRYTRRYILLLQV